MKALLFAALGCLAGCSSSVTIEGAERKRIQQLVEREFGYDAPLRFGPLWRTGGNTDSDQLCGEFTSPAEFNGDPPKLRYLFDGRVMRVNLELHRLWVTASPATKMMMDGNRALFDRIWQQHCEPHRPMLAW